MCTVELPTTTRKKVYNSICIVPDYRQVCSLLSSIPDYIEDSLNLQTVKIPTLERSNHKGITIKLS